MSAARSNQPARCRRGGSVARAALTRSRRAPGKPMAARRAMSCRILPRCSPDRRARAVRFYAAAGAALIDMPDAGGLQPLNHPGRIDRVAVGADLYVERDRARAGGARSLVNSPARHSPSSARPAAHPLRLRGAADSGKPRQPEQLALAGAAALSAAQPHRSRAPPGWVRPSTPHRAQLTKGGQRGSCRVCRGG